MDAEKILRLLWGHGFHVTLTGGDGLKVSPSSTLDPNLRELVRVNKAELVKLLTDSRVTADALMEAAMRVCDKHDDSPAAREDMRQDVLATPPHLQQDLLDHFTGKP